MFRLDKCIRLFLNASMLSVCAEEREKERAGDAKRDIRDVRERKKREEIKKKANIDCNKELRWKKNIEIMTCYSQFKTLVTSTMTIYTENIF